VLDSFSSWVAALKDNDSRPIWLWDHAKALLSKVTVEGKYRVNAQSAHYLEAGAIHETELPLTRCEESADAGLVAFLVDPLDVHNG
jgi:hypothetical protein